MAAARINIKNIDYFKFKKLIIDGSRDDYNACSKEVKTLCDCVQTLNFRDEDFDDECDRGRFQEICNYYKQILCSKRIDAADMRIKSGWWGDHKNAYSAGKLKPAVLKDILLSKSRDWGIRHGASESQLNQMPEKIDGPGLYVFKHKDHQCFQFVGRADRVFARCAERLKTAFDGTWQEPLAALLIISMCNDWDFYFIPVDDERVLRILENDLILKHDSIWPHGLNFRLHIDSLLEVSEFRKSCLRHRWPPEDEVDSSEIDLNNLRRQIVNNKDDKIMEKPVATVAPAPAEKFLLDEELPERPPSALSTTSTLISTVTTSSNSTTSSSDSQMTQKTEIRLKKPLNRPGSATKAGLKKLTPNSPRMGLGKSSSSTSVGTTSEGNKSPSRPTTPNKVASSPSENGDTVKTDGDSSEADSTIDRTPSQTSLSSIGEKEKQSPSPGPVTPRKGKASTPRPSSARTKTSGDKSKLPVSGRK